MKRPQRHYDRVLWVAAGGVALWLYCAETHRFPLLGVVGIVVELVCVGIIVWMRCADNEDEETPRNP